MVPMEKSCSCGVLHWVVVAGGNNWGGTVMGLVSLGLSGCCGEVACLEGECGSGGSRKIRLKEEPSNMTDVIDTGMVADTVTVPLV